ncbi:hypothetical protein [Sporosarcina sp. P37]|nr:hypothetical protein [Sporosarcina sp. P37]
MKLWLPVKDDGQPAITANDPETENDTDHLYNPVTSALSLNE